MPARAFPHHASALVTRDALPPALVALADSYDADGDDDWCGFTVGGSGDDAPFARVALADSSGLFDLRLTAEMQHGRVTRIIYAAVSDFAGGRLETSNVSIVAGVGRRSVVQTLARGGVDEIVEAHRVVLRELSERNVEPFEHSAAGAGDRYLRRRADEVATTSTAKGVANIVLQQWRRRLRRPQLRAPVTDTETLDRIAHMLRGSRR